MGDVTTVTILGYKFAYTGFIDMNIFRKIYRKMRGIIKSREENKQFDMNVERVKERAGKSRCSKYRIVDCGFNQGIVASNLLEKLPGFSLTGFEIQQDIQQFVDDVKSRYPDRQIEVIYSAVSDSDGSVEYYEPENWGKNYKGGTTTVQNKKSISIDYASPKQAPAIDFSRWLREEVSGEEFVFVKMDIEGAEYSVIDSLLSTGAIELIDVLAVEWHAEKFPEPQRSEYLGVENRIKEYAQDNSLLVLDWY